jgi:hypothetical protein
VAKRIEEEWGYSRRRMDAVVDCEFRIWQPSAPVARMIDSDAANDILDDAVDALSLAVSLWVIGCGHGQISTEKAEELAPKGSGKTRIPVGHNRLGQPVIAKYVL